MDEGGGGGAGDIQWYYDSDQDGRLDCWRDATTSAVMNSPYGQSSWRFHYGIDLGSVLPNYGQGAPIRSIGAGVISATGSDQWNGNFVTVDHYDGLQSRYIHLHTIDVSPGISVLPGFQVGTMNCTGSCSSAVYGQNHVAGTHLHLEVAAYVGAPRTPEGRLDPEALMSACE